jgi:hypothetical protein
LIFLLREQILNSSDYLLEQATRWPKEKVQKDKQRSTKHTHKTKDRVTRTPLKSKKRSCNQLQSRGHFHNALQVTDTVLIKHNPGDNGVIDCKPVHEVIVNIYITGQI